MMVTKLAANAARDGRAGGGVVLSMRTARQIRRSMQREAEEAAHGEEVATLPSFKVWARSQGWVPENCTPKLAAILRRKR